MSYSSEYILSLISEGDPLGRNKDLDSTMVFFNNLLDHEIYKTKKAMFPCCNSSGYLGNKYEVVYFDAWMNDVYSNPMRRCNID